MMSQNDIFYMQQALDLAVYAQTINEVPVGAVLVFENKIIGTGYNQPISSHDPTAHAEIIALRAAAKSIKNYRLVDTTMYVTLEPCAMCAAAMLHARVKRIMYAAADLKTGALGGAIDLFKAHKWNHQIECSGGLLAETSAKLLQDFFRQRR